jgi:UDP-N-acetylglucosamine:LPS N-acetylglucosamine transferase
MAALMGVPAMLQEQNALPGLTNRLLARFVRKVATAFKECESYFGRKTVLTGNPVRAEFSQVPGRTGKDPFTLLVFGGSQGAQPINQSVVESLAILKPQYSDLQVIHQTGERKNAEALAQAGAAEMILQKDLNGRTLAARIRYYADHRDVLRDMERKSRALGRPDATERIVDLLEELSAG